MAMVKRGSGTLTVEKVPQATISESDAANYVQERFPNLPGVGYKDSEAVYDQQIQQFVPRDLQMIFVPPKPGELQAAQDALRATVARLAKTNEQEVLESTSWDVAKAEVESARKACERTEEEAMKSCWVQFEKHAPTIKQWFELLPSESWQGSILCGSLKILCNTAIKLHEIRSAVANAMSEIPVTINYVDGLKSIYRGKVFDLCQERVLIIIVDVVQECLQWSMTKKKFLKTVFKGPSSMDALEVKRSKLIKIQTQMDRMNVLASSKSTHNTERSVLELTREVKQLSQHSKQLSQQVYGMDRALQLLKDSEIQRIIKEASDMQKAAREREEAARKREFRLAERERENFLIGLDYQESLPLANLKRSLTLGLSLTAPMKCRTTWILQSDQVRDWLDTDESCLLVVNGKEGRQARNSTVSFFSALLWSTLMETRPRRSTVLLYWFCGQNTDNDVNDVVAMLECFVGQLLDAGLKRSDFEYPSPSKLEFGGLVDFFVRCIRNQLLETPVYCIIDSISWYEGHKRVAKLEYLVEEMIKVIEDRQQPPYPFKVLATSPTQSLRFSGRDSDRKEVVTVPPQVPQVGNYYQQIELARSVDNLDLSRR